MYQFTDDCLTGITEIDNEHRRLFQMINETMDLLKNPSNTPVLAKNLLTGLKEYAATHFAHEEAYMEQTDDPELFRQKKEHAAFNAKLNTFDPDSLTSDTARDALEELLKYLVRWLYHHILSSDIMIGRLPKQGQKAKTQEDPLAFTKKYFTGIEMVDAEHQRLFEIIRDADDLIHAELLHDRYDEIMRILEELRNYTEVHFHDEEVLMESIAYPELESQKLAHAAFVERLVNIDLTELETMDNNQLEYLEGLMDFLVGWLTTHILQVDKKIGDYVRDSGIKLP